MPDDLLLLRFNDRPQAVSVLAGIGIGSEAISEDGVMFEATGETAEFEGEIIALTRPVPGYHVSLAWRGDIPPALMPYLVPKRFGRHAQLPRLTIAPVSFWATSAKSRR